MLVAVLLPIAGGEWRWLLCRCPLQVGSGFGLQCCLSLQVMSGVSCCAASHCRWGVALVAVLLPVAGGEWLWLAVLLLIAGGQWCWLLPMVVFLSENISSTLNSIFQNLYVGV